MSSVTLPRPLFSYLEKVVVFHWPESAATGEGTIGEYAIVIDYGYWNRPTRTRSRPKVFYKVRCLGTDRVLWLAEGELVKTGGELHTMGLPSDDCEIAFDKHLPDEATEITGSFRLPRDGWRVFRFCKQSQRESLYKICLPMPGSNAVTMSLHYHVSVRSRLDRAFVKRRLRILFGGKDWKEVSGPESSLFTPETASLRVAAVARQRRDELPDWLFRPSSRSTSGASKPSRGRGHVTNAFVEDGWLRLQNSAEFQAKLQLLEEEIERRYAAEMAEAGFLRRWYLRWRMVREYQHEAAKLEPSDRSLF